MRLLRSACCLLLLPLAGCADGVHPTSPSLADGSAPTVLFLEGEPGSGEGVVLQRSAAIGGQTLHLAPGERRSWTFSTIPHEGSYVVAVTYSNSRGGSREALNVEIDSAPVDVFEVIDTGEKTEGWNVFATHPAGAVSLGAGRHALVIQSTGGDGCVEIDFVTVARAER